MIAFNLEQLNNLAHGQLQGQALNIQSVSTDSRHCQGALFVALKGERFDGHDFVQQAIVNGAVAVAISRPIADLKVPVLFCEDTQRLLGLCGLLVRTNSKAKVLALTGSCGKTTVKEFCASILSLCGNTIATQGNFNNDIGVPLTLLRLESQTQYAVIEQGASHPLDIARTSEFVQADCALINNAGQAHIEGFGSELGVYQGKSEILDAVLGRGGLGLIPFDSPWYDRWQHDYQSFVDSGQLLSFGTGSSCYVQLSDLVSSAQGLSFKLSHQGQCCAIRLELLGAHNAYNATAAAALAISAGANLEQIKQGLEQGKLLGSRLSLKHYSSFKLIDDAYNASYNSVIAAIDTLSQLAGPRLMIFGDMGELGAQTQSLHTQVGQYASTRLDALWCLGQQSLNSVAACPRIGRHFSDHDSLIDACKDYISTHVGCTVLIKGSHAMQMDMVVKGLVQFATQLKDIA